MHVILTGATGLIGASVLNNMLAQEGISRISILSRRPVALAKGHEDKAKVIIHKDFKTYDEMLLEELKDAQGCVWALGVSQNDVSESEYFDVTHEYPVAAAQAFSSLHPESRFTFVHVSGEGATHTPGMFTSVYGRVKGQVELTLFDFAKGHPNFRAYNVRPGAVDWRQQPEIHNYMPRQPIWKSTILPPLNVAYKGMVTPTRPMGKLFAELAMSQGEPLTGTDIGMEGTLLPNTAIRRLAGL